MLEPERTPAAWQGGPPDLAVHLRRLIAAHPDAPLAWLGAVLEAAGGGRLRGTAGVEVARDLVDVRRRFVDDPRRWGTYLTLQRTPEPALPGPSDRGPRRVHVYQSDALRHPSSLAYLDALRERGAALRLVDAVPLPIRICIGDRGAVAVVPLDPDRPGRGSVVVHRPALVRALRRVFDRQWSAGRPLPTRPGVDADTPERRRSIVELMTQGHTDPMISAELGLSLRTVTREVEVLMRETGAATRFQLGALLGDGRRPVDA